MKKNISTAVKSRFVPFDELMPILSEQINAGCKVRFSPRGVSMLPMLRQGIDSVELSKAPPKLKKYDIPLYRRNNGQYVLHRIVDVGETYTCIGDAQFVKECGIRDEQIIAVVTSFNRGKRCYSVTSPVYRIYCRIWHYSRFIRHFAKRSIGWLKRRIRRLFSHSE